jgi:23S rRNA (uracil1939-C5)-methyltransferase
MSGEIVEGKVLRAVNGGYGLLQIDGKTVFARNALKGEEVTIAIKSKRKGVLFGEAMSVETRHVHRRNAPCAVAGRCGGCHYQTAEPIAQEEAKKEALQELLGRAHIDLPVSRWTGGPEFGWRTRAELHGARLDDGFTLGFFEERSHRVVPAAGCLQVSERMRALIELVVRSLSAGGVKAGSFVTIKVGDLELRNVPVV